MKRKLILGALAVAAASMLPAALQAQDTVTRAGTVARQPSYESLMTAVAAAATSAEKIAARMTLTPADVRVVSITDYVEDAQKEAFDEALDRQKDNLPLLHAAIGKSGAIRDALAAHAAKPDTDDIVAVDIADAGEVIVYYKK